MCCFDEKMTELNRCDHIVAPRVKKLFFLPDGGKTEYSRGELRHSDVICSTKKTIKTDQLRCDNNSFNNIHILCFFFPLLFGDGTELKQRPIIPQYSWGRLFNRRL